MLFRIAEDSDVKAVVASLNFIIFNSSKYNVNGETVAKELQQLGLPKEHSEAVSKVYLSKKDVLRDVLRGQTLKCKSRAGIVTYDHTIWPTCFSESARHSWMACGLFD